MFAGAYHGIFDEVLVRPTRADGRLRSDADRARHSVRAWSRTSSSSTTAAPESLDDPEGARRELAAVLVEPVQSRRPELQPRRIPARAARDHRADATPRWSSTRSSRASARTRAAPRRCSASAPTSRPTARSSAAVCRSASSPARPSTWTRSTAASGVRGRLVPGGRRDVLRRHVRPPPARPRCRQGGARSG